MVPQTLVPESVERLQLTRLPKFTASTRNFYRWRKDWESLQGQRETSGSAEVLGYFYSVDEKICRDLQLSTYKSIDDIFYSASKTNQQLSWKILRTWKGSLS